MIVGFAGVTYVRESRVDLFKMNEGGTTVNPSLGTILFLFSSDNLGGTAMHPVVPCFFEQGIFC